MIRRMRFGNARPIGAGLALTLSLTSCGRPIGRQYEYEEQLYLSVKGSATVIVDASIPALVALRGLALDPAPSVRTDQEEVRRVLEAAGCHVVRVGQPWRRAGRRFVQVRLEADDVRTLSRCGLLAWSQYTFDIDEAGIHFRQTIATASGGDPGTVNWTGSEVVGFKLHMPSRILYHNVRRLSDGEAGVVERGNILTSEQTLADRRAGKPLDLDTRVETQPILNRTLWLFGGSFLAALVSLALIIWLVARRGRRSPNTEW
jgi:hypothetical protein